MKSDKLTSIKDLRYFFKDKKFNKVFIVTGKNDCSQMTGCCCCCYCDIYGVQMILILCLASVKKEVWVWMIFGNESGSDHYSN